jgi:predicted hydrolase (HD superfamily)
MTRQEALQTLQVYTKAPNLIAHHLATEAAMKAIGQTLINQGKTEINLENWGLAGLLHDADYEITRSTPEKHTLFLEEKIGNVLPTEVMRAIKAHNFKYTNVEPQSLMDWALYTCDELTGFVVACALVQKNRQISSVTVDFVLKKMNEKGFAKNVDRSQILACREKLGFPIEQYIQIVLNAMQSIATNLGFEA